MRNTPRLRPPSQRMMQRIVNKRQYPVHKSVLIADRTTNYFSQLSDSFAHTSFQSQLSVQVILILSAVVLVLIGIIVVMWRVNKKKAAYIPHGWVLEPAAIATQFSEAITQRSKFEVQFHSKDEKRRSTFCSPLDFSNDTLTLEAAGLKNISKHWVGRNIDCFFRVQDEKHNYTYYTFTGPIAGLRPVSSEICHVYLKTPEKLERKQRRAALRVDPPEQYILGLALWEGKELSGRDEYDMNIKHWGKPALAFIPGKKNQLSLDNISAGGIKITVKRKHAKECALPFTIGDLLMVLLDLWEPETGERMRFWVACRVRNPFIDFETHDVEVGLQFIDQLQLQENSQYKLEKIPQTMRFEVEEIGNWAMHRHLEIYREKGLE